MENIEAREGMNSQNIEKPGEMTVNISEERRKAIADNIMLVKKRIAAACEKATGIHRR